MSSHSQDYVIPFPGLCHPIPRIFLTWPVKLVVIEQHFLTDKNFDFPVRVQAIQRTSISANSNLLGWKRPPSWYINILQFRFLFALPAFCAGRYEVGETIGELYSLQICLCASQYTRCSQASVMNLENFNTTAQVSWMAIESRITLGSDFDFLV